MRHILIITLLLTGCTTPKTVYVDKIKEIRTCPGVIGVDMSRPELFLTVGGECNLQNVSALIRNIQALKSYSEGLELEVKRLNDAINRCREGEK